MNILSHVLTGAIVSIIVIKATALAQSTDLTSLIEGVEIKRSSASGSTGGLNGEVSAGNLRIGFVDMNRLFTSHPRTKTAETELNRARADAKEELDVLLEGLKALMDQINITNAELEKPDLSSGAKNKASMNRDEKVAEARSLDTEIAEFRKSREAVLQEKFVKMRKEIITEISSVVQSVAEEHSLNVLFDLSGMSMGQVPVVVYTNNVFDITDACTSRF